MEERSRADVRLVITTCPPKSARDIVRSLVDDGLVACGNVVPGITSIYRWKGTVEEDAETLVFLKTTADRVEALTARLGERHPYDVPEMLVLDVDGGSKPYLDWVREVTR
jgi:periplasmic divalent cation tolerance protein